jgi:hypothetical protein
MLTLRRRLIVCCAAAGAVLLAAALDAPGALAAPVATSSFGPAATARLIKQTASAWKISQGNGVTVAVLSTGVDPNVDGLQGKVTLGHDYVPLPYPASVSGTVLASAIAGSGPTGGNVIGPLGRAPQAKILSIRVLPDSNVPGYQKWINNADWEDIDASAITEAVNSGAQVIVVDFVGSDNSQALESAVRYAVSKNVVVVCDEDVYAAGQNDVLYPCALPGVIGAATVVLPDLPAPSQTGRSPVSESILVAAPGNQLLASGPQGAYTVQNYYSSLAWLAGTAALIKSVFPKLSPALVARAIAVSALDHPAGGYNTSVGFGLINPDGALQEASVLSKLSVTAAPGPGVVSPSARLASGRPPGVIDAVHHATAKLDGYGGAAGFGLACLIAALVLALFWRRRPAVAVAAPGPGPLGPPGPAWPGQVPVAGGPEAAFASPSDGPTAETPEAGAPEDPAPSI